MNIRSLTERKFVSITSDQYFEKCATVEVSVEEKSFWRI